MSAPRVSVVIPVRNGADVIETCLRAMKEQSYPAARYEVLVVDDESTDATPGIVERTAEQWRGADEAPQLRLVRQGWSGAGAARNRGVSEATGEVVLFTDADCEPVHEWISAMVAPLEDPAVAAVAGGYLTRQRSVVARLAQAEFEERYRFLETHADIDIAFTHSAAVRRDVFLDVGGFDERMPNNADDLELSYRLAQGGHRIVYAAAGQVYHRHPATWSDYVRKKFGRGFWRTLVFKRYPGKLVRDSYTPQTLKLQIFLVGLSAACFVSAWPGPGWLAWVGLAALGLMIATALPFALRVSGGLMTRLLAPLFLLVQAGAIGTGVLFGMFDRIESYRTGGKRG